MGNRLLLETENFGFSTTQVTRSIVLRSHCRRPLTRVNLSIYIYIHFWIIIIPIKIGINGEAVNKRMTLANCYYRRHTVQRMAFTRSRENDSSSHCDDTKNILRSVNTRGSILDRFPINWLSR